MKIIWDERKRLANLEKHGMDFAALDTDFFVRAIFRPSHSGRILAFGHLTEEATVAVVFRSLGSEAVSIVSMRPASKPERRSLDD